MPFWVLLLLVVGLTGIMVWWMGPLQVLTRPAFAISHLGIWVGIWFIWGYVVATRPELSLVDQTMLIGGMWTLGGGVCYAIVHVFRTLVPRRRD